MRILAFSDWRVQDISDVLDILENLNKPVDFVIYAGDDINRFKKGKVNYFSELANRTKQKKVLAVIGNDDTYKVKKVLKNKATHDLHAKPLHYKEYTFIGLEGSTKGPGYVKYSETEVRKHLTKQSKKSKQNLIVVSHTPPHGVLDMGVRFGIDHIGSTALNKFIEKKIPRLVICGHCHSYGGKSDTHYGTYVFNVSSHDSIGSPGNICIIDLNNKKITHEWFRSKFTWGNELCKLHGIGPSIADLLNKTGIRKIQQLANIDPETYYSHLSPSIRMLRKFKLAARSYLTNRVFQTNECNLNFENPLYYDIETDLDCKRIWLIGALFKNKFYQFYADTWKDEPKIIKQFLQFLKKADNATLVSYSTTHFDHRVISNALERLSFDTQEFLSHNNVDLGIELRGSFIMPPQEFKLKSIGSWLGYPFKHDDLDGFLVALEYHKHIADKTPLPQKILEYNEDDVKALPFIIKSMKKYISISLDSF